MARPPNRSRQTLSLLEVLLAQPRDWHYGYDLARQTGLASGTLYPILMRLEGQGWLEAEWDLPQSGGRPRHLYRLTGHGYEQARVLTIQVESAPHLGGSADATTA